MANTSTKANDFGMRIVADIGSIASIIHSIVLPDGQFPCPFIVTITVAEISIYRLLLIRTEFAREVCPRERQLQLRACRASVRAGRREAIDHRHGNRRARGLQLEPELFFERREQARSIGNRGCRVGSRSRAWR